MTSPLQRPRQRALVLVLSLLASALVLVTQAQPAQAAVPVPPTPTTLPKGIEALQPYVGQSTCSPSAKPGVQAFRDLLLKTYPGTTNLGIVRDCGQGGQSEHKEGRAFDWGVKSTDPQQKAQADALLAWLIKTDSAGNPYANARRLGVMYMVYNRRIWKAYEAAKGWQPYSGSNPHTEHVHFSFGWNAARKLTSWWDGTVAPVLRSETENPGGTPVRSPQNLLTLSKYQSLVLKEGAADATATTVVQRFLGITADGAFGPNTAAAVKQFQSEQGMAVSGVVDTDDWRRMFPPPIVPFGRLESAGFGIPGVVTVRGWAADADTTEPLKVHVYVNGQPRLQVLAGDNRPDVEKLYPGMGPELGYTVPLVLPDGTYSICTYAINVGPGGTNPKLGCLSVRVRHTPTGRSEKLAFGPGVVSSAGWTIDGDSADPVKVATTVDGKVLGAEVTASAPRSDIGALYPAYGANHGYDTTVDLATVAEGSRTICTVARNIGMGSDTQLGCVTGTVRHSPFGRVDQAVQTPEGIVVRGWAVEPDVNGPAKVSVTLDGKAAGTLEANLSRGDIGRTYPEYGALHGFRLVLPTPAAEGNHTLCLSIANVGPGKAPAASCRTVVVNHRPLGRLESVTASAGRVTAKGWALDPDTTSPVTVHVAVDGKVVGKAVADQPSSAAAAAYPSYGPNRGFAFSPPTALAKGTHQVCAYAINQAAGSGNPALGCLSVTV